MTKVEVDSLTREQLAQHLALTACDNDMHAHRELRKYYDLCSYEELRAKASELCDNELYKEDKTVLSPIEQLERKHAEVTLARERRQQQAQRSKQHVVHVPVIQSKVPAIESCHNDLMCKDWVKNVVELGDELGITVNCDAYKKRVTKWMAKYYPNIEYIVRIEHG